MKEVLLTHGFLALVDDEDFSLVCAHRWYKKKGDKKGRLFYAQTSLKTCGRWRLITMHRFILGTSCPLMVDHVNGNGLDNRRSNLRATTASLNKANAVKETSRRPFKGVCQRGNSYSAEIGFAGRLHYLGSYSTAEEAARAYDRVALLLFGEFARLNFSLAR